MLLVLAHMSLLLGAALLAADTTATHDVEFAARSYRITVYEQFRTDRPLYDRYIAAGEELIGAWRQTEEARPSDAQVFEWFQSAQRSLAAGTRDGLRPLPAVASNESSLVHEISSQRRTLNDGPLQISEPAPIREAAKSTLDVVEPPLMRGERESNDVDGQFPAFDVPKATAKKKAGSAHGKGVALDRGIVRSVQRALWRAVTD